MNGFIECFLDPAFSAGFVWAINYFALCAIIQYILERVKNVERTNTDRG